MPEQSATRLAQINAHDRDSRITFQEEGHVYTVDGVPNVYDSVTTVIHHFFSVFDADKVIDKMMASKNWPNNAKYFGMSKEEIKAQWAAAGEYASSMGSKMHLEIEMFFDDPEHHEFAKYEAVEGIKHSREFEYFLNFYKECVIPKIKIYRTEMYVFDEETKICGSIDALFQDLNDPTLFYIGDWKRSNEIKKHNPWQSGLFPVNHLEDTNYSKYSLQLNLYKYILEKKYNMRIGGMFLIVLHPKNDKYIVEYVHDMGKEIENIITYRANENQKHEEVVTPSGNA
jgi:hypothetical protein